MTTSSIRSHRSPSRARVAAAAAVAVLFAVPVASLPAGTAQGLWDQLSPQEQQAVLTRVRDEMRAQMALEDSPLVPDLPQGGDDPRFKAVVGTLLDADTAGLAAHAGEIAAGEYDRAIAAGIDAAAGQLAQYLLGRVTGTLPEDSATRVYLEYAAGKGDALTSIGQAFFDDRRSWGDFAEVAWVELNKAAVEDVQAAGEEAVKRTINFALGEGPLPGMSPGEVYLEILKAEVVVLREFEVATVRIAANNLYEEYRRRRERADAETAWDEVYTLMLGSSGMAEVSGLLAGGSVEDLRLGGYVLRHVDETTLRGRFEECYEQFESPCTVQVETAAAQQQAEAQRWVAAQVAEMKTRLRGRAAEIGRDELRSIYAHLGDSLRREIRAAYQATEQQQQALREARYTVSARLERIRQLSADMTARCQEFSGLEAQTRGALGTYVGLDAQLADTETLLRRAGQCEAAVDDGRLADLAGQHAALLAEADRASTAACSWPEPTTLAGAREVLREAAAGAQRTAEAAAEARAIGERMEGIAPASIPVDSPGTAARTALEGRLGALDEAIRTADNVISLRGTLRDHAARGERQYEIGMQWLQELESAAAPFRGITDLDQMYDEAQRLMGVGPYTESDGTVLHCSASMRARLGAFERESRPGGASIDAHRSVLARWRSDAQSVIAACPVVAAEGPDPRVAAVAEQSPRLDAFESAAALCLARAQQIVEEMEAAEETEGDAAIRTGDADVTAGGDAATTEGEGAEMWVAARIYMPENLPALLGGLNAEGADPEQILRQARNALEAADPSSVSWTSENTGEVYLRVGPETAATLREALEGGGRFSVGVGMRTAAAGGLDVDGAMLLEAASVYSSRDELVAGHPNFEPGNLISLGANGRGGMRSGEGSGAIEIDFDGLESGWSGDRQQEAIGLMADAMTTFVAAAMDPASGLATEDCFIATAVYGDVEAPQLVPLRRFRDRVLLPTPAGRKLVRLYYRYGPGWADWVRERPAISSALRAVLDVAGPVLGALEADAAVVRWSRPLLRLVASAAATIERWRRDGEAQAR